MTGKKHEHIVKSIMPGSIAEELGIEPGDKLLSIDGQEIEDIFDYQFYVEDEEIVLLIEKQDGEQWELEIEKDAISSSHCSPSCFSIKSTISSSST